MNTKLIVNADDLGLSLHRDKGIFDLISLGIVTSVSVVVNTETFFSSTCHEILKIIKQKKEISVGLHLNLTEGKPISNISNPNAENSILDENGYFIGKAQFHEAASNQNIDLEQVNNEIKSQIVAFVNSLGFYPNHVNGHQHVHVIPSIARVLAQIMKDYSIKLPPTTSACSTLLL